MVLHVTELLLTAVLTCQEANLIASRTLLNRAISTQAAAEVIHELRQVTVSECVLPNVPRA